MTAAPDAPCEHAQTRADVEVRRLTTERRPDAPITGYSATVAIACTDCGERFRWVGVPAGWSGQAPMVSADEFELHAPIRPATSDPDFGLGIPGVAIRLSGGDGPV